MNQGERNHRLNLFCGASLKDDELRIAMYEVNNENPNEMCNQAKKIAKEILWQLFQFQPIKPATTPV